MSDFGSVLESLYSRFVLRDLFAKITPGFIAISATASFMLGSWEAVFCRSVALRFWHWLILLAAAWITGFVLQHAGIILGALRDDVYKRYVKGDEDWISRYFASERMIMSREALDFRNARERVIVIKEACGNTMMALIYWGGLLMRDVFINRQNGTLLGSAAREVYLLVVIFVSIVVLWMAHRYHYFREKRFDDSFRSIDC